MLLLPKPKIEKQFNCIGRGEEEKEEVAILRNCLVAAISTGIVSVTEDVTFCLVNFASLSPFVAVARVRAIRHIRRAPIAGPYWRLMRDRQLQ